MTSIRPATHAALLRAPALHSPGGGLLGYAALVALCALCYGNSLWGEFVHDDVWAILNNPDVRPGSSLRNIFADDFWGKKMADNTSHKSYRPLCVLTFKLNILLGGMTPFYFHMVNVCLHSAVTCLLMHTCEHCVFWSAHQAFLTALLFAVHPIHTEAVSGIVGRADVLASMLFLLAFLSYIRSVPACGTADLLPSTTSPCFLMLSLFLGTCAMLVKETGVTVFGVCVLYDGLVLCHKPLYPLLSRCRWKELIRISQPFIKRACVVSVYLLLILSARLWLMGGSMPLFSEQDNPASFSPFLLTRFLTYCYLLAFNAWLLLAPVMLCYDWQVGSIPLVESLWDARNIATLVLALCMLALCLHCATSLQKMEGREVLVGILFLVFPFIPATNLFFRVGFVVAERVLYMPSMGYCILLVHGLNRLGALVGRWGAAALTVSMLLLVLLFSWKTVQQNEIWLSREALFRSGIQTLPHNAKVHYNYANFLKDRGQNEEAIHHYKTALRLYPRHASAMNNLGTLTHSGEEAELYYRKALDINPQHNRALFNLGNLLKSQGKEEEAEGILKESIRFGPQFADAYSSLASLYADQSLSLHPSSMDHFYKKRFAEASEIYTKGIENCPDSSDLHNNYGVFLVDTGNGEQAAIHYQHAVRLKPSHYVAMVNLARLLRSSNESNEAELWYKRALQVVRKVDILTPLGALYYNTGRYEEALRVYQEAASLQPDNPDVSLALAQVLAMAGRSIEAEKMTLGIISRSSSCIECYRLLSAIYSRQGNHTESYKLAVALKPDQSQAWMNMGGIQHIKGDYAAARVYYQRALLLSPGSRLLKENLAKLDRLEKKRQGS
ncbi:protein O-mannosyl-transferase TMTC1 isoform X4 [Electrophorus electricus]|uniref:protein O-mannosyl-transferase TMTC1 isoform X4 n=1 Tax=Electrophorus electricus TaxID=8005 RepID=UPI0015D05108|nr:protein O-mannosyl-transferase TMTC1 isoform X4 [Electrophorus electricus]